MSATATSYGLSTQDTLIDPDGNLRSGTLANLLDLLDVAKAEGLSAVAAANGCEWWGRLSVICAPSAPCRRR